MVSSMTLSELKQTVLAIAATCLPQIARQDGFRKAQFFDKQSAPLLVVSLQSLTAENGGFYGTVTKTGVPYTQTGTLADCCLRLSLFLPRNSDADAESLLQSLAARLATAEEGDFYKLSISDTSFLSAGQCFVTHLSVQSRFVLLQETALTTISNFQIETNHQ